MSIYQEGSRDHFQKHFNQRFVCLFRLTSKETKEQPRCYQFFANLLKCSVFYTKTNDELSSNRFVHQKSNAWDMSVICKTKSWLTIVRWGNGFQMHIIYEKTRKKSRFYMSKMSSSFWKRYISLSKRFSFTNDIACSWLWSCSLSISRTIDLRLCWRSVISTSKWPCCQTSTIESSFECWSKLCFNTLKTISKRKTRTFFCFTLYFL